MINIATKSRSRIVSQEVGNGRIIIISSFALWDIQLGTLSFLLVPIPGIRYYDVADCTLD